MHIKKTTSQNSRVFKTFTFHTEYGSHTAVFYYRSGFKMSQGILVRCMTDREAAAIKRMEKRLLHVASDLINEQVIKLSIEAF